MNCQELTQLLDDGDIRSVPPALRRELDAHLSGCADCAAEWRVQEKIVMTPAMWVPAGFVAQCRQLVAAGAARLAVRRRVILYSTVLVMAAAAAMLAWRYWGAAVDPTEIAAMPVIAVPAPVQVQPAAQPAPKAAQRQPQPAAPPRGTFTVTVRPLQIEGIDAEGNALAARFRERVITLLRAIPNLVLVDSPSAAGPAAAGYELRMTYASTSAAPQIRIVRVEVGTSAEFLATEAAIAAEATMSPEDRQRSELARQLTDTQKRTAALRRENTGLSRLLGGGAPALAIIQEPAMPVDRMETAPQQLVKELRVNVFPLDEAFEQEQLATLRNPAQRQAVRMRALGALLIYAERRGGFPLAGAEVVRAGGEFALIWEPPTSYDRPIIWDGLAVTRSPELVPYLIRGLNEDPLTETRLQIVKILAETYGDDPRAQAALAAAARSNDQQTVRMAAMRVSGDPGWREYVVATLANATLPDAQRLQPIADMAPGEITTLGTSPRTRMVLDEQQLRELGALVIRIAPDHAASEIARKALFAAGAMETPAALDMLIEVAGALRAENYARGMEGVAVMSIRQTAHQLISMRYAGNPQARAVIEDIARNGDAMDKLWGEFQLGTMGMKADMEKARQNQPPAEQPAQ